MRHIDKIIIKPISESRAASSCGSDIDRQELINNYGNEKYLSKWSIEGQDNGPTSTSGIETTTEQKPGESQAIDQSQTLQPNDDDNGSLMSYNSVRDGSPSKNKGKLPYQVKQPSQDITLWQGYSGNIYFDSVRCRALRILSSKPNKKTPKEKATGVRLTKSCSPPIEFRALSGKHLASISTSSFQSLGSLRISSREEKKKHTPPLRTQSQYSKLRKGFVEKMENRRDIQRSNSTPESLVIAGGQLNGKSDPIDSVYRLNTKMRLSSKSREGLNNYDINQNFPSLIARRSDEYNEDVNSNVDNNELTRLPRVDQTINKSTKQEPKPVFIIPFAALDDPVEPDPKPEKLEKQEQSYSTKSEKQVKKCSDVLNVQKPVKPEKLAKPEKPDKPVKNSKSAPVVKQSETPNNSVSHPLSAHIVNITGVANNTRVSPRYDFQVRREISNSSLSNYLQAVPQCPKTINIPKEHQKVMPRLSYTQRSKEYKDVDIDSNDTYNDPPSSLQRTSALYGGYLPSTRATNEPNFYAELRSESVSESSSVTSPQRHVTKSILKKVETKGSEKERNENKKCHLPVIGWNVS